MPQINITDIDCVYVSGDEPRSQEFWEKLQEYTPRARRVHGVVELDFMTRARAGAQCSSTERFVLIPSDVVPNADFFQAVLDWTSEDLSEVSWHWPCQHNINTCMDACYGISVWNREHVHNLDNQKISDQDVDRVLDLENTPHCVIMHDCVGTVYANQTAQQAWRAGFLEGVRLSLYHNRRPTVAEFRDSLPQQQLNTLSIWHNIGTDTENGIWAIAGARQATYMTVLTAWPWQRANNTKVLQDLWESVQHSDPRILAGQVGIELHAELRIPVAMFDAEQSRFFKHHLDSRWHNRGLMLRRHQ